MVGDGSNETWRHSFGLTALLLAGSALSATAAHAGPAAPDAGAHADSSTRLGEVIITARKTRERLQDVPVSVTALSGKQLNDNGHLRIEDLNQLAPSTNVVITNGHQTSFSIRGIGGNPGNDGLESSAGVFLDGVYLGRPGMAAMDLIDLDQVELLRGPQGTLFGKNTTAGAVNITTKAPSFDFGGQAQATYGNYNYQQYQATVTGPLIGDVLAGRLTAFSTTRDGTVEDLTTGKKVSNQDRDGVRGQLLWRPNDSFSLRLIAEAEREQQSMGAVFTANAYGATPATLQKNFAAVGVSFTPDPTGMTTSDGPGDRTGTRQTAFSAEANWKVGGLAVTSLTAFRGWRYTSYADADGTAAPVVDGGYNIRDHQWSEELRVKFPRIGPMEAVAGIYYFQQNVHMDQITDYGADAAAWLTGIPVALVPVYAGLSPKVAAVQAYDGTRWDIYANPTTYSYAAFGQAVWRLTPQFNLTTGFRETYETKSETVSRPNPISLATGQAAPALAYNIAAPFGVAVNNAAPSFVISADYRFAPRLMAYASISSGEKAGGVNPNLPAAGEPTSSLKVQPEQATDYEVGIKSELFNRRLTLNLNAFYTIVSDYQATYQALVSGQTVSILTNVGKVHTRGVELEAAAHPIRGLTLTANASYNDAYYAAYPSGPCPAGTTGLTSCNLTGEPVAGAPRWISNTQASYEHRVTNGLTGYVTGEYSYRSNFFGYLDDSPYTRTGGYGLLNLRVGLRPESGRWDLSLWGKNVADVHYAANYLSYGTLLPGAYVPFFGDPATYGVTLRVPF